MLLLAQHLVLVIYLNLLLLSSYNNFQNKHNLISNHLCNKFLDHLWTFESSYMFLNDCSLVDKKSFFHRSWYCSLLILLLEDNIAYNLFNLYLFSNDKTKSLFTPWKLALIKKIWILVCFQSCYFWLIFVSVNCSFNTWFQLL